MKYKGSVTFSFIIDEQEYYDSLIEDGYLPDEAERCIKDSIYEMFSKIEGRADNVFYFPYMSECEIKRIDREENN